MHWITLYHFYFFYLFWKLCIIIYKFPNCLYISRTQFCNCADLFFSCIWFPPLFLRALQQLCDPPWLKCLHSPILLSSVIRKAPYIKCLLVAEVALCLFVYLPVSVSYSSQKVSSPFICFFVHSRLLEIFTMLPFVGVPIATWPERAVVMFCDIHINVLRVFLTSKICIFP